MGFLKFFFSPKVRLQDLGLGLYPIAVLAQPGCPRRPPFLAPSTPLVRSAEQGQAAAWGMANNAKKESKMCSSAQVSRVYMMMI